MDGVTLTEIGKNTSGRVHLGVKIHGSVLAMLTLRCFLDLQVERIGSR